MTPTPPPEQVESIREQIAEVIGDVVGDFNSGGNIPDINKTCPNELDVIMRLLQRAELEAQIAELRYWQWQPGGHIEISRKVVDTRIADLQQQLTEMEK